MGSHCKYSQPQYLFNDDDQATESCERSIVLCPINHFSKRIDDDVDNDKTKVPFFSNATSILSRRNLYSSKLIDDDVDDDKTQASFFSNATSILNGRHLQEAVYSVTGTMANLMKPATIEKEKEAILLELY